MSQQFYERFVSLFFGFIILLMLISVTAGLFFLYFSFQNPILYYAYLGMLLFDFFYFIKYYLGFRIFRETLSQGLLFPSKNNPSEFDILELEDLENIPLKVCLFYRNGSSLKDIAKDFGFNHPTKAKRQLVKGLDILLKNYEKEVKV